MCVYVRPVFWERLADTNGKGFLQRTNFKMERQERDSKSLDATSTTHAEISGGANAIKHL